MIMASKCWKMKVSVVLIFVFLYSLIHLSSVMSDSLLFLLFFLGEYLLYLTLTRCPTRSQNRSHAWSFAFSPLWPSPPPRRPCWFILPKCNELKTFLKSNKWNKGLEGHAEHSVCCLFWCCYVHFCSSHSHRPWPHSNGLGSVGIVFVFVSCRQETPIKGLFRILAIGPHCQGSVCY